MSTALISRRRPVALRGIHNTQVPISYGSYGINDHDRFDPDHEVLLGSQQLHRPDLSQESTAAPSSGRLTHLIARQVLLRCWWREWQCSIMALQRSLATVTGGSTPCKRSGKNLGNFSSSLTLIKMGSLTNYRYLGNFNYWLLKKARKWRFFQEFLCQLQTY
jgi:hypothetical protein